MIPIFLPCIRTVRSLFAKQVSLKALWVRAPRTALMVSWLNGTAAVSKTAIPNGYPGSSPGLTV